MAVLGLETWLIGTPAELDAAARALADIGRVVEHGTRTPLAGADAGRLRTYARIRIAIGPAAASGPPSADGPPTLTDLAA